MEEQSNIFLKYQMEREAIIRFQVIVYCYMNGLINGKHSLTSNEIDAMTLIGLMGKSDLTGICEQLSQYKVCGTVGSARNLLTKMQDKKMIYKEKAGGRVKIVYLNPDMKICTEGNILLDIKCYAAKES